ncbi:MAG: YcxB family protein [Eubacteriaceae bacterium]
MEVKFNLTNDDYWNIHKASTLIKLPVIRQQIITNYIAMPILFLLLQMIFVLPIEVRIILYTFFMFLFFLCLYIARRMMVLYILKYDKTGIAGEHTVKISSEGISDATPFGNEYHIWRGILLAAKNKDYVFVYMSTASVIIIPKRAFETKDEAEEFYNKAVEYWKAARNVNA